MMNNESDRTTTLVLGGTGMTGRRVAQQLVTMGRPTRIGSRQGDPPFQWDDDATWEPALRDIGAVYLVYPTDLGLPAAARVVDFAGLAVERGARRLVLLSGRGQVSHGAAEEAIRESGADWTIVRSAWLAQNFSEGFLAGMVEGGILALPAGDATQPFVDADDVAAVAAAALTDHQHAGAVYEVTGPEALTFSAAVDVIAQATGQPLRYSPTSSDEMTAVMSEAGVPGELIHVLEEVFAELREGRAGLPADGVFRALGRPPRSFVEFARTAAGAGALARL